MMNKPEKQSINGILLVNKPIGLTSNAVLQHVKRLFNAKKAGHTGSLDPLATGMLPICFGEATKLSQYLLDADKCYQTTARLGVKTTTADSMGEVIHSAESVNVTEDQLRQVLTEFQGEINQIPSMYSALKHQGKALYKYARAGIEIERKPRAVTIQQLVLNQFDGLNVKLTVECTKGTYIRNLVEDIGERLGTYAHVTQLHRSYTAGFNTDAMYALDFLASKSMDELMDLLLPMDRAIQAIPQVIINEEDVFNLRQGKIVTDCRQDVQEGVVRMYDTAANFIGLGEIDVNSVLKVKRLIATH